MRNTNHYYVDPDTGTTTYSGPSVIVKGSHAYMPSRTSIYRDTDERFHIQRSSLGGSNSRQNIVPGDKQLNHNGYHSLETAEREALLNGADIWTEKTAYIGQPDSRPEAFLVSDTIHYQNHTEKIYTSFLNETYELQEELNAQSESIFSEVFPIENPSDSLRSSLPAEEYADLMTSTDMELPTIHEDYQPAIYLQDFENLQQNEFLFEEEIIDEEQIFCFDEILNAEENDYVFSTEQFESEDLSVCETIESNEQELTF